jgi:hypothetical protein
MSQVLLYTFSGMLSSRIWKSLLLSPYRLARFVSCSPQTLHLTLEVTDPETVAALSAYPSGTERLKFALLSLKIGSSALQIAGGNWQTDIIRGETTRLVEQLTLVLGQHSDRVCSNMHHQLHEYFAPESGRFNERIDRLLRKDGDLETVLRTQVSGENSDLSRRLSSLIGHDSPLVRLLSPNQQTGIVQTLRTAMDVALIQQRQDILKQFSLDDPESALSRMVRQVAFENNKLTTGMGQP